MGKTGNTVDGSYVGATQRAFKYATHIGARPIKMLFWEYSDLNPIINGEWAQALTLSGLGHIMNRVTRNRNNRDCPVAALSFSMLMFDV